MLASSANSRLPAAAGTARQVYAWGGLLKQKRTSSKAMGTVMSAKKQHRRVNAGGVVHNEFRSCSNDNKGFYNLNNGMAIRRESFRMMTTNSGDESKESKTRIATVRLYRMLRRSCKGLAPTDQGTILIQNEILASDWGKHSFRDNDIMDNDSGDEVDTLVTENQTNELIRLFLRWNGIDPDAGFSKVNEWYDELMSGARFRDAKNTEVGACWTTPHQLRETVRFAFLSSSKLSTQTPTELQGLAVRAIQMMQEQNTLWKKSSVSTTLDGLVRVTATSRCLGTVSPVSFAAPSSPLDPKYRFAYRIRVENISPETTVQLLGRYWHITEEGDGSDEESLEPIEVDAPYTGAVGQLPVLRPGQAFEYVSGTDLATPVGTMKGHFYMATVPEKTKSAKSGDDVVAVSYQGSKGSCGTSSSSSKESGTGGNDTRLFHAAVKPFRLESFEK
ncbi:unnamed protein product [Pseudo-nitzschia multistriata]|uniref:ApaG domain-containing protein n=1 Tax=Pseudo-nitzschia multistriata TaxID=183589 RepID=A0A448Z8J6_9STRA|nr:unnamed protein product [Pseudo-nitzschia multistriata]